MRTAPRPRRAVHYMYTREYWVQEHTSTRARAADASFVLNRKQDMDADVYGDAKDMRYFIFVS